MAKPTRNILIIVVTIILVIIYLNKCNRKTYHYNKMSYTLYDNNEVQIFDTIIYQLGEVKSFKDNDGNWSEFGIQNNDGHYVFKYISDPRKKENKTSFDVKDEKGEYYGVIDETEGTITIMQTESFNDEYLFLIVYMD